MILYKIIFQDITADLHMGSSYFFRFKVVHMEKMI